MSTRLYLVFTDDWELRGDGSGDPAKIQFRSLRELTRLFEERAIRGSFNAEVMQQMAFRRFQGQYPHLREWAEEWENVVTSAFRRGHDFQLHIHPQWEDASYDGVRWKLLSSWSILNYRRAEASKMIEQGIDYLHRLLRPIRPDYRCISFRAGAWCIAPSEFVLEELASQGIQFDTSMVRGIRFTTPVQLDYRHAEEGFVPFYPAMKDARRIAAERQPIVSIPTLCFREGPLVLLGRDLDKVRKRRIGKAGEKGAGEYREWTDQARLPIRVLRKIGTYLTGRWQISDIAQLDYAQMREMLRYVRRMAAKAGQPAVPVILANHTKDIQHFDHIKRFLDDVASAPDVSCITLTELSNMLQEGRFVIRKRK
jgi:hypothetical protein